MYTLAFSHLRVKAANSTLTQRSYCPIPQLSRQCAEFAASLKELKQYQIGLELLFRAKHYITSKQAEEGDSKVPSSAGGAADDKSEGSGAVGAAELPPASSHRHERDTVKLQILFEMGSVSCCMCSERVSRVRFE